MLNDQQIVNGDEKIVDDDWDSQDSNREDHQDFEYPENAEGNEDSEEKLSSDHDSDNEKIHDFENEVDAAPKHKKLKNSIFEKIFKSNKNWAY